MLGLYDGDVLEARGELRGDAQQLLVFRPKLLMVLEQTAVLISEIITFFSENLFTRGALCT